MPDQSASLQCQISRGGIVHGILVELVCDGDKMLELLPLEPGLRLVVPAARVESE